jgi:S-adenosylmethionine synthetase
MYLNDFVLKNQYFVWKNLIFFWLKFNEKIQVIYKYEKRLFLQIAIKQFIIFWKQWKQVNHKQWHSLIINTNME